jgi:hypothetical protein
MTVHVVYNVYQEIGNLPRSIRSVREVFGDASFVFVDGRYPDYPEGPLFSTDGTKEIAETVGHYMAVSDYECEKRTAGLRYIDDHAEDGDWVLVLDADETITSRFAWPKRVGYFSFTRNSNPQVTYGRCRLFAWEPGLHFKDRHYDLYDADGQLVSSLEDAPDFDCIGTGVHYDDSHDPDRRKVKRDYYRVLREREGHPAAVKV